MLIKSLSVAQFGAHQNQLIASKLSLDALHSEVTLEIVSFQARLTQSRRRKQRHILLARIGPGHFEDVRPKGGAARS